MSARPHGKRSTLVGDVRRALGAGLPERFYHLAVARELGKRGIPFASKPPIHVAYDGEPLGFVQPDFIVRGHLVLELKAVEELLPIHEAQVLTYLTASGLHLGVLVNCNAIPFGTGIRRKVNANLRWVPHSPGGPGVRVDRVLDGPQARAMMSRISASDRAASASAASCVLLSA